MDKRSPVDYSLFFAVLVGAGSLLGLCLILALGQFRTEGAEVLPVETSTPFKYAFLGTEPGISTLELETSTPEEPFPGDTIYPTLNTTPDNGFISFPTMTPTRTNVPSSSGSPRPTSTKTFTPTVEETMPFAAGKYDDTDLRITHSGNWVSQTNVGNAYNETLHVSNTLGNYVAFTFVGQQLQLGYQGGPGLGTVRITIDTTPFLLTQTTGNEWSSAKILHGRHFVIITHDSGGSVNLDYINIPDHGTPTPTATSD